MAVDEEELEEINNRLVSTLRFHEMAKGLSIHSTYVLQQLGETYTHFSSIHFPMTLTREKFFSRFPNRFYHTSGSFLN